MNRVCIIGNSHLGAYKLAIDGPDIPNVSDRFEFDTFGSIRASLNHTRIINGKLVPQKKNVTENFQKTSGGQSEIDLKRYSAFVITVRNSPYWIRPYLLDTQLGPLSDAMVQAIHTDFLDDWSIHLTASIAEAVPKARVFFVGRPFNSERDFLAKRVLPQLEGPDAVGASVVLDTLMMRLSRAVRNSDLPDNVTLMRAPDHLLDDSKLFTRAKYSRGAADAQTGMRQVFKEDDTQHMNGVYGAEMLQHMLSGL
ncbi:MAG: hypothetical protein AB3N23_00105 [Paracoccaceae bacterium]